MAVVWALLFSGVYVLIRRYPRGAIVALGLVVSHWVLDLVTHRPDLPLMPFARSRRGPGTVELAAGNGGRGGADVRAGLVLYRINTEPVDKIGTDAFVAFAFALLAIYAASLFGPPPPDERMIAYVGPRAVAAGGVGILARPARVAIRQW